MKLEEKKYRWRIEVFGNYFYIWTAFGPSFLLNHKRKIMIIKETDLEALDTFVEQNKHHDHKIDTSHLSLAMSSTLQFDVVLVVRFGHYATRYLSFEGGSIDLVKWEVHMTEGPIEKVIDATFRLICIKQAQDYINKTVTDSEQYFQDVHFVQELARLHTWGKRPLDRFFNEYKSAFHVCDTDKGMKELFKIPIAKFSELGFSTSYEGKNKTRDYYKKLFANHEDCVAKLDVYYQDIEPRLKMYGK